MCAKAACGNAVLCYSVIIPQERHGVSKMTIERKEKNNELVLVLGGRLDTTTVPMLETELGNLTGVNKLVMDFEALEYLSSAGLRVLLLAQKKMGQSGNMVVRHVNDTIAEIFEITGFASILTIE